jgi:hypothetical protein
MRLLVAAAAVLLVLASARAAWARAVSAEPSAYGRFELQDLPGERQDAAIAKCRVAFRSAAGKRTELFTIDACTPDLPRVTYVAATETIGGLALPVTGADGQEFHVFEIASARGGNATAGSDYWLVVVRGGGEVWGTRTPFASGTLQVARIVGNPAVALELEEPPTTTSEGARYTARFGSVTKTVLAALPTSVASRGSQVLVGKLVAGSHATSFRPAIDVGPGMIVIDDDGRCPLAREAERGGVVKLAADVTTWTDGRRRLTCVAITR